MTRRFERSEVIALDEVVEVLARVDVELAVDVVDVGLGRGPRYGEALHDVLGVAPAGQKIEDLALARGEPVVGADVVEALAQVGAGGDELVAGAGSSAPDQSSGKETRFSCTWTTAA